VYTSADDVVTIVTSDVNITREIFEKIHNWNLVKVRVTSASFYQVSSFASFFFFFKFSGSADDVREDLRRKEFPMAVRPGR